MIVGRERLTQSDAIRIEIDENPLGDRPYLNIDSKSRMPLRLADKLEQKEFKHIIRLINNALNYEEAQQPSTSSDSGTTSCGPIGKVLMIVTTLIVLFVVMAFAFGKFSLAPSSDNSSSSGSDFDSGAKTIMILLVVVFLGVSGIIMCSGACFAFNCIMPMMAKAQAFQRNLDNHVRPLIDDLNAKYKQRGLRFELVKDTHLSGFRIDSDGRSASPNYQSRYFIEIYVDDYDLPSLERPHVIIT